MSIYDTDYGELRVQGMAPEELEGDVLLVVPHQQIAHRLIRASSPHNTFLVTEQCDQLCIMCSQPPKAHHVDLFDHFETAALLAPTNATIGISGGEPLLHKERLFGFLTRVAALRSDLSFHVLTNAQHVDDDDLSVLKSLPANRVLWGIPLYSTLPFHHDRIVEKDGAFDRLMKSMLLLARSGAAVELRTVVTRENIDVLPSLAAFVARRLPFIDIWAVMQLENIGFGRMNWDRLFFDNGADFSILGRAIDIAAARGIRVELYNFPLCTVPEGYRRLARSTISDWKRKYLSVCGDCCYRQDCGGFFEWYPEAKGYVRVGL